MSKCIICNKQLLPEEEIVWRDEFVCDSCYQEIMDEEEEDFSELNQHYHMK